MHYAADHFFVLGISAASLVMLILNIPIAVGAYVFYRSVVLQREIATRRVLGARRAAIVRMLLVETTGCILVGILLSSPPFIFLVVFSDVSYPRWYLLVALAAAAFSGAIGGWLAACHASKTPFDRSGLFRGASDKRGEH